MNRCLALRVVSSRNGGPRIHSDDPRIPSEGSQVPWPSMAFEWNRSAWDRLVEDLCRRWRGERFLSSGDRFASIPWDPSSSDLLWDPENPQGFEDLDPVGQETPSGDPESLSSEGSDDSSLHRETSLPEGVQEASMGGLQAGDPLEPWFWFVPAHRSLDRFGVHLFLPGCRKVTGRLVSALGLPERTAAELTCFAGIWLASFEGWTEALCSLADTLWAAGEEQGETWFELLRQRAGISREERALAATLTRGMARMYLQRRKDEEPLLRGLDFLCASLGGGYERYVRDKDLLWWPTYRPLFQRNLLALLVQKDRGGLPSDLARAAMLRFLEPSEVLFPRGTWLFPRRSRSDDRGAPWEPLYLSERYPLYVDGA